MENQNQALGEVTPMMGGPPVAQQNFAANQVVDGMQPQAQAQAPMYAAPQGMPPQYGAPPQGVPQGMPPQYGVPPQGMPGQQ